MEEVTRTKNVLATTLSTVREFHAEGRFSDVQLQIGTERFNCQRSLLAAISEYFDTMFSSDFKESNTASDQPIILHEIDASAFKEILSFLYAGEISVNDSNVYQLIYLGDYLRLRTTQFKERCVEHLESHIHSEELEPMSNALDLLSFAIVKEEKVLINILTVHICQHLYHYSMDTELVDVTFQTLNILLKFSKNYILSLPGSQDVMLKIIHSWINHDREGRRQHRCKLMNNINFANISPRYTSSILNRLENLADKVVNVTEDVMPALAELETLRYGVDIDLYDGNARLKGYIVLNVENVNEIQVDGIAPSSSPCKIANLAWQISLKRSRDNDLVAYLICNGRDKTSVCGCWASAYFTVPSHAEGKENFVQKLTSCLFRSDNGHNVWGFDKLMPWTALLDEGNGYILDNSFSLVVRVYADVPFHPIQEE